MIRLILLVRGNKRPVRTQTHIHREPEKLCLLFPSFLFYYFWISKLNCHKGGLLRYYQHCRFDLVIFNTELDVNSLESSAVSKTWFSCKN